MNVPLRTAAALAVVVFTVVCTRTDGAANGPTTQTYAPQDRIPYCDSDAFIQMVAAFREAHDAALENRLERGSADYDSFMASRNVFRFDRVFTTAEHLLHNNMHDCQRLIVTPDESPRTWIYGPLVAIFVDEAAVRRASNRGVVAELYNFTPTEPYRPLEITTNRSMYCLWMDWGPAGQPDAWILRPPAVPGQPVCDGATPDATRDLRLRVVRRTVTTTAGDFHRRARARARDTRLREPYPATGRWLWADRTQQNQFAGRQYIGMRCGLAWCELSPTPDILNAAPFEDADSVPGWFDEQYLAYDDDPDSDSNPLTPSSLWGRIEPGPATRRVLDMGEHGRGATIGLRGTHAARDQYRRKFDIHADPVGGVSRDPLFLRRTGASQLVAWTHRTGYAAAVPLKPVANVPHSGIGTVRWRWLEDDETGWLPCFDGCCPYKD